MTVRTLILILVSVSIGVAITFYDQKEKDHIQMHLDSTLLNPATTVVVFDLHGVVLEPRFYTIVSYLWHHVPFKDFILFIINPTAWPYIAKFVRNQMVTEQDFNELVQDIPRMAPFKPVLSNILALQRLNDQVIGYIDILKKRGFTLYVLSNIWQSSLDILLKRFPELTTLFNGFYVPSIIKADFHKPQSIFYEQFKEFLVHVGHGGKEIIFFDNDDDNVQAARKAGIKAYGLSELMRVVS